MTVAFVSSFSSEPMELFPFFHFLQNHQYYCGTLQLLYRLFAVYQEFASPAVLVPWSRPLEVELEVTGVAPDIMELFLRQNGHGGLQRHILNKFVI